MNRDYIFDYIFKKEDGYYHHVINLNELECGGLVNGSNVVAKRLFTGIFDRHGSPIYEGDIIKSGLGEIIYGNRGKFQVKWHDRIYKNVRGTVPEDLFANSDIAWEVIGNIHENSDLIL